MNNKSVFISGASKGLGAVIARCLVEKGYDIALNYRTENDTVLKLIKELKTLAGSGKVLGFKGDITSADDVKRMSLEFHKIWDSAYGIINNAVAPHEGKTFDELTVADYEQQMACSIRGPLLLLEAFLPSMKKKGTGRIINIGSELQVQGNPEFAHYIVGKMGMQGLTRTWSKALGIHGVTVNMICPGWTPVERHAGSEEAQRKQAVLNPMGRLGSPEDIASTASWFMSSKASFVSGQLLAVNGANTIA